MLQACPPWLNGSAAAFHKNHTGGGGVRRREHCRNQGQLILLIEVYEMLCGGHKVSRQLKHKFSGVAQLLSR